MRTDRQKVKRCLKRLRAAEGETVAGGDLKAGEMFTWTASHVTDAGLFMKVDAGSFIEKSRDAFLSIWLAGSARGPIAHFPDATPCKKVIPLKKKGVTRK